MMKRLFALLAVAAVALPLVAGCSKSDFSHVTGVVKINGQPVQGAVVTFAPAEGGRPAFAKTGPDGAFELNYTAGEMGAKLGVNKVYISTYKAPTLDDNDKVVDPGTPEKFPPEYNETPSVTREVKPGENTFEFDVETTQDSFPRTQDT